jgi:hypothetical protein
VAAACLQHAFMASFGYGDKAALRGIGSPQIPVRRHERDDGTSYASRRHRSTDVQ